MRRPRVRFSLRAVPLLLLCTLLAAPAGARAQETAVTSPVPEEAQTAPLPQAEPATDAAITGQALLSRFVDYGLVFGASAGTQLLTSSLLGVPSPTWFAHDSYRLSLWAMLTMSVPLWTYFTVLDAEPFGATLGKRLMGLRVVNDDGSPLSPSKSLLRTAFMFLGWELSHVSMFVPRNFVTDTPATWQYVGLTVGTVYFLADFVILFLTGGRKGLADLVVGTRLVRR